MARSPHFSARLMATNGNQSIGGKTASLDRSSGDCWPRLVVVFLVAHLHELWPERDVEAADTSLQGAISLVRSTIGKTLVTSYDGGYALAGQSVIWVDLDAAQALLKAAAKQGPASTAALPLLEEALSFLERGIYLEEESDSWVYAVRANSENALRQCYLWLAENYEAQGQFWLAGEQYRALLRIMPPDEQALERWMMLLSQQGKPAKRNAATRK